MANTEQKLKEFFSDKEKVKEFLKDEEFIGKVSGGAATSQDYADKFKTFGVELTKSEAEDISKATNKLLSPKVEKLDDKAVEDIAGGKNIGLVLGGTVGVAGTAATIGTFVASCVYDHKYRKSEADGDSKKARKYKGLAESLDKAAAGSLAITVLGAPVAGISGGLIDAAIANK